MSASERLKERLYPVMDVGRLTLTEASAIVAVIEAAEASTALTTGLHSARLLRSLADLNEALS